MCDPTEAELVKTAMFPDAALSGSVPRNVLPSKNDTVPVAALGVTVAVNLTATPKAEGLRLEVRLVLVDV